MKRSFFVLGGCGAIGRVAVRDLFASHPQNRIVIADYNEAAAHNYASSFRSKRVGGIFADASDVADLFRRMRGSAVVVNCTQHDFNLRVMSAALRAKVHYVDLGGLFYWTRKQLRLNAKFKRAGVTAIVGAGCAPGVTNVMARLAVDRLAGRVDSIKIRVGSVDFNPPAAAFCFPYSAQTIVEEMTLTPWIFRDGKFREIKPRSRWEAVDFPKPVGRQWTICTRHSEVATIPLSFKIKDCDFNVSFDRSFVNELVKRMKAGQTIHDFQKLPAPRGKPDDYEIARVVARRGKKSVTVDCHAKPKPSWHASAGDIDTGCPPSIVAQMIADGTIAGAGVLAPELHVPVAPFFAALRKRGMKVTVTVSG